MFLASQKMTFGNYLYYLMSIYINQQTRQLNLANIFVSTADPNDSPLTIKLESLSTM